MEYVALVTLLAIVEYMVFVAFVGRARVRSGIAAPAVAGDPVFERYLRVQQNTVEQLVVFLPALWVCGWYLNALAAAGIGMLFVLGRVLYFRGYVADPGKRALGFVLGFLANVLLVLGGIWGALAPLI